MTILYRIFGAVLTVVSLLLAVSLVFALGTIFSSPINMLSGFLMVSIILYTWYSLKFHRTVLQQRKKVKRSLRDYIRVNGIVAMVFSIIIILEGFVLMAKPELFKEAFQKMGIEAPIKNFRSLFLLMSLYGIILLTHINWTFLLMKKNDSYFE